MQNLQMNTMIAPPATRRRVDPIFTAIQAESPAPVDARAVIECRLREAIRSGRLQPGTRVRQQALAQWFSVSRMPVREALRQLEAQGYLVNHLHKGYVVHPEGASGGVTSQLKPLREQYAELSNDEDKKAFEAEILRFIRGHDQATPDLI